MFHAHTRTIEAKTKERMGCTCACKMQEREVTSGDGAG